MVKQSKIDEVNDIVARLEEKNNFILTRYSGVKVQGLNSLRNQLREKNASYKVIKNNLFKRALETAGYTDMGEYLKGPLGVAFMGEEVGEVAKVLQNFSKEDENFSYTCGVIENILYNEEQIKSIASLPGREVLLAQTMSLINGPATGIAMGMNQIMTSLARGIKAVAEANNA